MSDTDTIFDDLFQGCAFAAFLEQARRQQTWPDAEATRVLAYAHYEAALAERELRTVHQVAETQARLAALDAAETCCDQT